MTDKKKPPTRAGLPAAPTGVGGVKQSLRLHEQSQRKRGDVLDL